MNDQRTDSALAEEVERIVEQCKPLIGGHEPPIQGAALADLLSIWLAGHHPDLRDEVLEIHVAAVRALIPHNEIIGVDWSERKPDGS